ncbi:insecticidal delta-endotoxin Cry8Ea1 family protein [Spirosoma aerolatum]|uniref:insecticidal delta-endotoxin Cry8Ea1 family protein n=1 Tax=Spirosoma aerolatum TaxID=1211326 RepID=UPI0009ABAD9D|nr:insecticidal delta-endotoxin Cry8Ea1 family protein [Spirosoma aerolatum]
MFLHSNLTTRRKFLERSLWGFGSAFVVPSLLASCTDHIIDPTNPNPPDVNPPLVGADDYDWNDQIKSLILLGLTTAVPEGGEILGFFVETFWPSSGDDVWSQVREQVEALIDEKIADDVYGRVSANLDGLKNVIINYTNAINNQGDIKTNWVDLRNDFSLYQPNFQQTGDEVLLLPLFAHFANMYLATLRDAVIHGSEWGMAPGDVAQAQSDLTQKITEFTTYTANWYSSHASDLLSKTPENNNTNQPFFAVNTYERQMTLSVLHFMDTWQYYDISRFPNGAVDSSGTPINLFYREIYSDPYGNTRNGNGGPTGHPLTLPQQAATQRPTQITVWSGSRIDAVQLTYPANGGPGGVTQTPRMGDPIGGSNAGNTFTNSPDNPIIQAQVSYDYYEKNVNNQSQAIGTMFFTFSDKTNTHQMGSSVGYYKSGVVGYTNHALSSIYSPGYNTQYGNSANCIVFGFMYWLSPTATLGALRSNYVTNPIERSLADFAKAFPKLAIPAGLISEELKAARKAHWASIKARAKK